MGCASSATVQGVRESCGDAGLPQSTPWDCATGEFDAKYSRSRKLGSGGFAKVYAVRRRADNEALAVKVMSPSSGKVESVDTAGLMDMARLREHFRREVDAWSAVRGGDHVVRLVAAIAEPRAFFIVTERCESTVIAKISAVPELWARESRRMLGEMLRGVQACHLADVVHRDVKPDNFLVGADGRTVKLCDFGLAAKMPSCGRLRDRCGTLPFMSPEMLAKNAEYGKPTDVWSYGCTAYLLCCGRMPFAPDRPTLDSMRRAVLAGAPRRQRDREAAAFVERLLERSDADRCTAGEALAHQYLRDSCPTDVPAWKKGLSSGGLGGEAGACGLDSQRPCPSTESETTSTGSDTPRSQGSSP